MGSTSGPLKNSFSRIFLQPYSTSTYVSCLPRSARIGQEGDKGHAFLPPPGVTLPRAHNLKVAGPHPWQDLNLRPSGYERNNCPDCNLRSRPDLRVSPSTARISPNPHVAHAVHDVRQIMDNLVTRQATAQDHTLLPSAVQGSRREMAGECRGGALRATIWFTFVAGMAFRRPAQIGFSHRARRNSRLQRSRDGNSYGLATRRTSSRASSHATDTTKGLATSRRTMYTSAGGKAS